jgi:hypothetical protein
MAAMQSIHSLFSSVRRFKWNFVDIFNPTHISCVAFSVEEAREVLLQYLTQIESLQEEKNILDHQIEDLYNKNSYDAVRSEVAQLREQLDQKLPPIENNIGCFCTSLFDYSRHMEIHHVNGHKEWKEMTLEELILTTEPTVEEFKLVSFNSCLNG